MSNGWNIWEKVTPSPLQNKFLLRFNFLEFYNGISPSSTILLFAVRKPVSCSDRGYCHLYVSRPLKLLLLASTYDNKYQQMNRTDALIQRVPMQTINGSNQGKAWLSNALFNVCTVKMIDINKLKELRSGPTFKNKNKLLFHTNCLSENQQVVTWCNRSCSSNKYLFSNIK